MSKEKHVHGFWPVLIAMLNNLFVTVIKFVGFAFSGSGAMFSEAVHSFADFANQLLLMIGIKRSQKAPNAQFSYGYGQERYFWALVSACGIFFIGAGFTAYHGITDMMQGHHPEISKWTFVILGVSFILESFSFLVALKEIKSHNANMTLWQAIKSGDPTTVAILYEDGVAVLGVVVASVSIILAHLTGSFWWDAIGSLIIACLLGYVAIVLANINRQFLIEKSMPIEAQMKLMDILHSSGIVARVSEIKSSIMNIDEYRVECRVRIDGHAFKNIVGDIDAVSAPRAMGAEIDKMKALARRSIPEIKHISIEIC